MSDFKQGSYHFTNHSDMDYNTKQQFVGLVDANNFYMPNNDADDADDAVEEAYLQEINNEVNCLRF